MGGLAEVRDVGLWVPEEDKVARSWPSRLWAPHARNSLCVEGGARKRKARTIPEREGLCLIVFLKIEIYQMYFLQHMLKCSARKYPQVVWCRVLGGKTIAVGHSKGKKKYLQENICLAVSAGFDQGICMLQGSVPFHRMLLKNSSF